MTWFSRERTARVMDGIDYAPGAQLRVVKEGLRLSGWAPIMGGSRGWVQNLHVGDVVTCTGYGAGMGSDPGFGVEFTSTESKEAGASHCEIWPSTGGAFAYRPPAGSLEEVPPTCILTNAEGENPDDCTTHDHEGV